MWLDEYPRAAGATRRTYRYGLKGFSQEFAHLRLAELDRLAARAWAIVSAVERSGRSRDVQRRDQRRLHPGPNPFANLRLEQSRGRKDLVALTRDELDELAEIAFARAWRLRPDFRAMILFSAYVGLRPGELFALRTRRPGRDEVRIRQNLDGTGRSSCRRTASSASLFLPPPAGTRSVRVPRRIDMPWLFVRARTPVLEEQPLLLLEPGPGCLRTARDGLLRAATLLRDASS